MKNKTVFKRVIAVIGRSKLLLGELLSGVATLDLSNINGEPVPREVYAGARVLSGFLSLILSVASVILCISPVLAGRAIDGIKLCTATLILKS